jgi:hypothetical protein
MTSLGLTVRVVAIGLWLFIALVVPPAVIDWLAHQPVRASPVPLLIEPGNTESPSGAMPSAPVLSDDDDTPRGVDLRGNEIARPVARYRLDRRGTLYEVHSPDTEVPHLRPPRL